MAAGRAEMTMPRLQGLGASAKLVAHRLAVACPAEAAAPRSRRWNRQGRAGQGQVLRALPEVVHLRRRRQLEGILKVLSPEPTTEPARRPLTLNLAPNAGVYNLENTHGLHGNPVNPIKPRTPKLRARLALCTFITVASQASQFTSTTPGPALQEQLAMLGSKQPNECGELCHSSSQHLQSTLSSGPLTCVPWAPLLSVSSKL